MNCEAHRKQCRNADVFNYVAGLIDEMAASPSQLLGALAELRLAASREDVIAFRTALRAAQAIGFEMGTLLLFVEQLANGLAADLRAA